VVAVTVRIPESLHEVLGERQSQLEVAVVAVFGLAVSAWILMAGRDLLIGVPVWRAVLAGLLILDVAAGAAANVTRGTNRYYARRPRHRLVFIAVHVHLLAIAWLLEAPLGPAAVVWAFTIVAALVVNQLSGSRLQTFVGGIGLALGIVLVVMMTPSMGSTLAAVAALFLMKVAFAFAVDHYQDSGSQ
jgi:hypothetical protein